MVKKIVSYIVTFILIILLVASTAITILSQTILKEKFVLSLLDKNNYYTETYNEIFESFKNNTVQSGLEETILDGIITEEQVKTDIQSLIKYIYTGKEMSIDTEGIKTKLQGKIEEIINENNKRVNTEEQQAINIYIETIANIYRDGIVYAEKYIQTIQNVFAKVQTILAKVQIIPYLVTLGIIVILIFINRKESLKYLSIACISTGTLFIILKIVESSTMQVHNILLLNKAFSNVIINAIQSIITSLLITGIVFCILGLLFSIIGNIKTGKRTKE